MFKHQYSTNAGAKGRLGYHSKELNLCSQTAIRREEQFKGNSVTGFYAKVGRKSREWESGNFLMP